MAKRHMKWCSTSLITGEIQIKTAVNYNLILVRMAIIKMTTNNKCCGGYRKKGNFCTLLEAMKIGTVTVKNKMKVPQKTKITIWSSTSTLGYVSRKKKKKSLIWKDTWTPVFTAALFTTGNICKQPNCPSADKWIKKMQYM